MALNEIYKDGNELVFPVGSGVMSGDLVQVGQVVGVAQENAVEGEDGNTYSTLKLTGVFKFETAEEFSVGDSAYFDGSAVTATDTDKFIGHVHKVLEGGFVTVRLVASA